MNFDLYILFLGIIGITVSAIILYFCVKYFELTIPIFAISPIISTIFFNNTPSLDVIATETTTGPGGYLRAAVLIILGIVGLFHYVKSFRSNDGKIPFQLLLLMIFGLIAVGSSYYSLDQKFTLIRSSLLISIIAYLLGFYAWLKKDGSLSKALNALFILATISVFIYLISMIAIPSRAWWFKQNRLIALWEHPNSFGAVCMLTYPIFLWKFYNLGSNKKYLIVIPLLINVMLHILTGSRTTLIASSIGVLVWFVLEKKWLKVGATLVLLFSGFITLILASPESLTRDEGAKISDLSSREDIWESAVIFLEEKPLLGFGFGVEGKIFQNEQKLDLEGSFIEKSVRQSLHNGYLSILIGVGLIGFLVWIITILFPLFSSFSAPFSATKAYALVTIITILISNAVESALTGYSLSTDTFFWIAWIILGCLWVDNKSNINKNKNKNNNTKNINLFLSELII